MGRSAWQRLVGLRSWESLTGSKLAGAIHRGFETRWVKPVKPGDTIQPTGIVKSKQVTKNSRWVLIDVMVRNQNDEKVAAGEAMVEFPN